MELADLTQGYPQVLGISEAVATAAVALQLLQPQWPVGSLPVVVTAPPPALLDMVIPLALRHASWFVCCCVPTSWVTMAHPARLAMIKQFHYRRCLSVLPVVGGEFLWLLFWARPCLPSNLTTSLFADDVTRLLAGV